MKVAQIVEWLNSIAPFESAEGFDNVGLLMGNADASVHTILFGMDVTESLIDQAVETGAEMIITHHPFIFHALKRIDYTLPQGRMLCRLMERRISVLAAHTNWDQASGGISDSLAQALGLSQVENADAYVRTGLLTSPLYPQEFRSAVQDALHVDARLYPASGKPLSKIAVAGGAYGEGYETALLSGADAYVVGEIAHHEILDACARGLTILDAGHFATEWPGVQALFLRFLADSAAANWPVQAYLHHKAPYAGSHLAL